VRVERVIFACVHSAGRSQMAAGFFNALADPTKASATAAGTQPAERVHPEAIEAMAAAGIDISSAKPQLLTDVLARDANLLVTMGCGESCPFVPGLERDDWQLADPEGQSAEQVRAIRDQIRSKVEALLERKGWASGR
jgi:arsenate reductase